MTSDPLELFRNYLLLFARIFGFVGPFFRPVMFLVRMVFFAILRLFPKAHFGGRGRQRQLVFFGGLPPSLQYLGVPE